MATTNCKVWDKAVDPCGYGRKWSDGKMHLVHRLEWVKTYGEIPKGLVVRHKCDNPSCYNIEHLELGTPKDNSGDMVARGRSKAGSKNHNSILTEEIVREVRKKALTMRQKDIAAEYGLSIACVSQVVNFKSWKHVKEVE